MFDALLFWLLAAAMTVLALAFVVPRLLARRTPPARAERAALNAAIGRRELAELDRARDEGELAASEYAQARLELERRVLVEARDEPTPAPSRAPSRGLALAIAIGLPVLAFALYALVGDPLALGGGDRAGNAASGDLGDMPARSDTLERHLARHPGDARGWVLLARSEFEANRFADAAAAYGKAIGASPRVAADAAIWCEYADALGMAQGGTLAGRPSELIERALALDAAHPRALEMAGGVAYEQHDYAGAARYWRQLLGQLAPGSPEQRELAAAVARVERMHVAAGSAPAGRK